jgi:hypothetical protein
LDFPTIFLFNISKKKGRHVPTNSNKSSCRPNQSVGKFSQSFSSFLVASLYFGNLSTLGEGQQSKKLPIIPTRYVHELLIAMNQDGNDKLPAEIRDESSDKMFKSATYYRRQAEKQNVHAAINRIWQRRIHVECNIHEADTHTKKWER